MDHHDLGDKNHVDHPEIHTAMTVAESLRRNPDPLGTVTLYEGRVHRRLMQTLRELRSIQAERQKLEKEQLDAMSKMAIASPELIDSLEPKYFGFVCSDRQWQFTHNRLLATFPNLFFPNHHKKGGKKAA